MIPIGVLFFVRKDRLTMKKKSLHEHLSQHKDVSLSAEDKLFIYQKFLTKKEHLYLGRMLKKNIRFKVGTSVFVVALLFVGLYGWNLLFDTHTNQWWIYQGVQAEQIGTIIKAEWGIEIINKGRKVIDNTIHEWDIITLGEWWEMIINISESVQAMVIGPAKFEVQFIGEKKGVSNYKIRLIEGNFVSIDTNHKNNQEDSTDRIALETPDGTIISPQESNPQQTQFVVKTDKNENISVHNKWSNLEISKTNNETEEIITETVTIEQIAVVDNEETTISISDNQEGENEQQASLSSSGGVIWSGNQINNTTGTIITITGTNLSWWQISTSWAQKNETTIIIKRYTDDWKIILNKEEVYDIEQNLYHSFVMDNIKDIMVYHMAGEQQKAVIARGNLMRRINGLYERVNLNNDYTNNDLYSMISSLNTLESTLKKHYVVPEKIMRNVGVIRNRLVTINRYTLWYLASSIKKHQDDTNTWELTFEYILTELGIQQNQNLTLQ